MSLGWQMQGVAIAWEVYALTHRKIDLGYVGLAQFLPIIGLSLFTGNVADRFDRKSVVMICTFALALCSALFAAHSMSTLRNVWLIYALLVGVGSARAFFGPSGAGLMANLVPSEDLPSAIALSSTTWQFVTIFGPMVGGQLYGFSHHPKYVYILAAIFEVIGLALFFKVKRPELSKPRGSISLSTLFAGVAYVRTHPILLGAITLDLFAVLLGGSVALLPVYARDILHTGSEGLGWLRSAPALGGAVMAFVLAAYPLQRNAGKALLWCVAGFGLSTILFGISTNFALSIVALALIGATDMVSVYVRQSLLQLGTPDEMRGRVVAVTSVFVSASNELGEFESGLTAEWFGAVPATVAGGIGTVLVVLISAVAFPAMRKVDRLADASKA